MNPNRDWCAHVHINLVARAFATVRLHRNHTYHHSLFTQTQSTLLCINTRPISLPLGVLLDNINRKRQILTMSASKKKEFPLTIEEQGLTGEFLNRLRDAQYLYEFGRYGQAKVICTSLKSEHLLPSYMRIKLNMLLIGISDIWTEQKNLYDEARAEYNMTRGLYPYGDFPAVDALLDPVEEQLEDLADNITEDDPALGGAFAAGFEYRLESTKSKPYNEDEEDDEEELKQIAAMKLAKGLKPAEPPIGIIGGPSGGPSGGSESMKNTSPVQAASATFEAEGVSGGNDDEQIEGEDEEAMDEDKSDDGGETEVVGKSSKYPTWKKASEMTIEELGPYVPYDAEAGARRMQSRTRRTSLWKIGVYASTRQRRSVCVRKDCLDQWSRCSTLNTEEGGEFEVSD